MDLRTQYTTVAIVLGGLLLAAALADAVDRFVVPFWSGKGSASQAASARQQPPRQYQVNIEAVLAEHLFGREQPVVQRQREAPVTRLQLRLLGVMSSPNEAYARALIAVGGDRGEAYRVGDQIGNTDAKLHEISDQLVLLDRGGRLERLELIRESVLDAPTGEDQDPAELPGPSANEVEVIREELEPTEQVPPELEESRDGREESAEPAAHDTRPRTWLRGPGENARHGTPRGDVARFG